MPTLGFIGAGNMAEAIARGVLRSGLYRASEMLAVDPADARRRVFCDELGIRCDGDSASIGAECDMILLAVKPQMMAGALEQLRPRFNPDALIISIAAGITAERIERALGAPDKKIRVIRVMPNTPMLVGVGMSGLAKGTYATEQDLAQAERIFISGGKTMRTTESLINAVTALSGSGPAYFFYLVETMAAAGAALGLPEADAAAMARQTIVGAARLLEESKDSPAELRRKVTSPGGTTHAAITTFESGGFAALVAKAMNAAAQRGQELSQ